MRCFCALVLAVPLLLVPSAARPQSAGNAAVEARNGMVVCVSPPAADVGVAILKRGGNAVDEEETKRLRRTLAAS